ncbi:MAG: uracil-DNA glycosylase [Chloroflexi bacterium CG15_BIG_FIL_POST_REV_8_21_14_020_46_15]|nr:MAG: uracil-DNA glycosylase [Chloroflexi bacterium CG15_BIG_FIL_POST_REV_8_21_14_020_46_15]
MSALIEVYRQIASCQDCELAKHRNKVVPGEGPEDADLLFIGEAPGWNEDQQGRPFVGAAGGFLDQLLASIGLRREQVYIANVIKCRPPQNRDPLPDEIQACSKWLDHQVEIIQPRVIVTLGRYSLAKYFPGESIGKIHGKPRKQNDIIYYPMYHPAAALHQGSLRKIIQEDMLRIPQILTQWERIPEEVGVRQLELF